MKIEQYNELKAELTIELTKKLTREIEIELRPLLIKEIEMDYFLVPKKAKDFDKEHLFNIVLNEVCNHFVITIDQINGRSRKGDIPLVRHTLCYICREIMDRGIPLEYIGEKIGGRDHSTVLHSIRQCRNMMDTNKIFKIQVENMIKKVSDKIK